MIKYIKGNVFNSTKQILAHSVNCRGVFGSGIALQIAKRYPLAKTMYLRKYKEKGWKPGEIQVVNIDYGSKIIVNMALQDTYGRTGIHTDLAACKKAFGSLICLCYKGEYEVCMPKVGSGLGGETWKNVERVLIECLKVYPDVNVDIYYL